MEPIDRFEIKLYDYDISENIRDFVLTSNDPSEVLDFVDQAVEGILHNTSKQFDRVVVYDRIQRRKLLDYMTDKGLSRSYNTLP